MARLHGPRALELAPRLVAHARPDVNKAVGPREAPEAVAGGAARGRSSTGGELASRGGLWAGRASFCSRRTRRLFFLGLRGRGWTTSGDVGETSSDAASARRCRMGKAAANEAFLVGDAGSSRGAGAVVVPRPALHLHEAAGGRTWRRALRFQGAPLRAGRRRIWTFAARRQSGRRPPC